MSKKVITAKFDSTCAETGRSIRKGDACVYDDQTKRVYASGSKTQQQHYKSTLKHKSINELQTIQSRRSIRSVYTPD